MSIKGNSLEYLLKVAETIISNCADQKTIDKYFKLKSQICRQNSEQSIFTLASNKEHSSMVSDKENASIAQLKEHRSILGSLKNTVDLACSKSKKRSQSRQITRKNSSRKKDWKTLSRARIDTFDSGTSKVRAPECCNKELSILTHLGILLKNAESCPKMLKTIKITSHSQNITLLSTLKGIEHSLLAIYQALNAPLIQSQLECSKEVAFPSDELIEDNRWLIGKLENLIKENGVLRRMVGQR